MKKFARRFGLDRWIAEGAPAFWVLGMSMLLCGVALRLLAGLFMYLDWPVATMITFWAIAVLVVCFVGCGIWFVIDALTGRRPTPWKKE